MSILLAAEINRWLQFASLLEKTETGQWSKIRDKIEGNKSIVPPGVMNWLINPVEIDDVPIVTLTLTSSEKSPYELRRIAEEMEARLAGVRNIFKTEIHGGYSREIKIEADMAKNAGLRNMLSGYFHVNSRQQSDI